MNTFVILVILWKKAKAKHIRNNFVINQCVMDALASVALLLTWANISPFLNITLVEGSWNSWAICRFWISNIFLWPFLMVSTSNLIIVTVERYVKVVHPLYHKVSFNKTKEKILLVIPWVFGIMFGASILLNSTKLEGNTCLINVFPSKLVYYIVGTSVFMFQLVVPLATFMFCYLKMFWVLSKRNAVFPQGASTTSGHEGQESRNKKAQKNVIITLSVVALAYVICWIWNSMLFIMVNYGVFSPTVFGQPFHHFSVCMIYLNCCINPFIYIIFIKGFKEDMKLFLKFCFTRTGNNSIEASLSN